MLTARRWRHASNWVDSCWRKVMIPVNCQSWSTKLCILNPITHEQLMIMGQIVVKAITAKPLKVMDSKGDKVLWATLEEQRKCSKPPFFISTILMELSKPFLNTAIRIWKIAWWASRRRSMLLLWRIKSSKAHWSNMRAYSIFTSDDKLVQRCLYSMVRSLLKQQWWPLWSIRRPFLDYGQRWKTGCARSLAENSRKLTSLILRVPLGKMPSSRGNLKNWRSTVTRVVVSWIG